MSNNLPKNIQKESNFSGDQKSNSFHCTIGTKIRQMEFWKYIQVLIRDYTNLAILYSKLTRCCLECVCDRAVAFLILCKNEASLSFFCWRNLEESHIWCERESPIELLWPHDRTMRKVVWALGKVSCWVPQTMLIFCQFANSCDYRFF